MAAYEMNQYKDAYQKAVIENAKSFARSLKAAGLEVAGDSAIGYTETHQVIVSVGYGAGPEVAERLERNNIILNYQATPDEEGFTASGALRMGVSEMTRFGFDAAPLSAWPASWPTASSAAGKWGTRWQSSAARIRRCATASRTAR